MELTWPILLSLGAAFLAALFGALWLLARRLDNYSIVDAGWALSLGVLVLAWAWLAPGDPGRRAVGAVLALAWSLRLGSYLVRRIARHHPEEDARYAELRQAWGTRLASAFFVFYQVQAFSVLVLATPFLAAASNPAPGLGPLEWAGLALALLGLTGESVADAQMARFKRGNPPAQEVCKVGLWRYSRHPNYFFESVIWWGIWLFAAGSPWGWATVAAPLLITGLLLFVTGIPPTEKSALVRKGDAYREYQRTTSPFIPLPPRG